MTSGMTTTVPRETHSGVAVSVSGDATPTRVALFAVLVAVLCATVDTLRLEWDMARNRPSRRP